MKSLIRVLVIVSAWAGACAAAEPPAVSEAWIRATPPGARTAAAYLTITSVSTADRLIGAATPAAGAVEIHTHVAEGGPQRMVRLDELALPAGKAVRLEPGGLHLMLLELAKPLEAGATVHVSLRFANAEPVELEVPVVDARSGATPPQAQH
jgi:copper(I)-binding protein